MRPRLILADLDGTLLDKDKCLSPHNKRALEQAANSGAEIIIATGRPFIGIPETLLRIPELRYFVLLNGAKVYDRKLDKVMYRAEIPLETANRIFEMADSVDAMVDCFQDDTGLVDRKYFDNIDHYIHDRPSNMLIRSLRIAVDDFRNYVILNGNSVQKIQFFFSDSRQRGRLKQRINKEFPELNTSVSLPGNLEINYGNATKGWALRTLCRALSVKKEETAAFGDGTNDISMIKEAGIGIAMADSDPAVLKFADMVAPGGCNDGVGKILDLWYADQTPNQTF